MTRSTAFALLLGTFAAAAQGPVVAQVEANKEVVRRFVAATNARDFDALDELVAPDVVRHSQSTPGVTVGSLDEFKAFLRQDLTAVPDAVQTLRMIVAEGDLVAVWANYAGTQTGPMGPFPPSGRKLDLDFAGVLRIDDDGHIAEIWVVWDNVAALTQLGHMEPPGS